MRQFSRFFDRRVEPCNSAARSKRGLVSILALTLLAWPLAASAEVDEPFGEGMPLVLKDGRIALVTVHTVPFDDGESELDPATRETLRTTFEPLATDCFLTAQAIGHVAPGITRDGDTLSAHRLARARADTIQAALADFGMPQPSVASVWDWQFLLEKSQVTLWVFSLTRGDDCDGTPLPRGAPALAAADDETTEVAADSPTANTGTAPDRATDASTARTAATAPARVDENASASVASTPTASAKDAATEATVASEATEAVRPEPEAVRTVAEPEAAVSPQPIVSAPSELVMADPLATAAVEPADPASSTDPQQASATNGSTDVAAIDQDPAPVDDAAGAPALTITFEMNSSFFPAGIGRELRAFLDDLPTGEPIEVELSGAVGNSPVRGASGEEAERYNAWMAERRIERVLEWLEQNAGERQLTFAERLIENDSTRQVRLRANTTR